MNISFTLDADSIDKAIKQLRDYQKSLEEKCEQLRKEVADRIASEAQSGFNLAEGDSVIEKGGTVHNIPPNVTVSVNESDDISIVIADGTDAVWVEFGAGVYYNTPVGTSPNPYSDNTGFTIGSYDKGNGAKNTWGYRNADGTVTLTHGTPANMPMYNAVQSVLRDLPDMAKRVFAND